MWDKFLNWLGFHWVRNRDDKGRFVADDKKTKGKKNAKDESKQVRQEPEADSKEEKEES